MCPKVGTRAPPHGRCSSLWSRPWQLGAAAQEGRKGRGLSYPATSNPAGEEGSSDGDRVPCVHHACVKAACRGVMHDRGDQDMQAALRGRVPVPFRFFESRSNTACPRVSVHLLLRSTLPRRWGTLGPTHAAGGRPEGGTAAGPWGRGMDSGPRGGN